MAGYVARIKLIKRKINKIRVEKQLDIGEVQRVLELVDELENTFKEALQSLDRATDIAYEIKDAAKGMRREVEVGIFSHTIQESADYYMSEIVKDNIYSATAEIQHALKRTKELRKVVEAVLRELESGWAVAEQTTGLEE